jgi:ABC-type nickel/cobalt efflux system permease component RcnA
MMVAAMWPLLRQVFTKRRVVPLRMPTVSSCICIGDAAERQSKQSGADDLTAMYPTHHQQPHTPHTHTHTHEKKQNKKNKLSTMVLAGMWPLK